MKNKLKIIFISTVLLALSGCDIAGMIPFEAKRDFAFNAENSKHTGLVALSAQCTGYYAPLNVRITEDQQTFIKEIMDPKRKFKINCNDGSPDFLLLKLPPGRYLISDIAAPKYFTEYFKSYKFTVYVGKVNYIGNLLVKYYYPDSDANNGGTGSIAKNASVRDIPILLAKFSQVPKSDYVINIMKH